MPSRSSKRRMSSCPVSSAASSWSSRNSSDEVCSPDTKSNLASTLFARPKSCPSRNSSSQFWRGVAHSSSVVTCTLNASSISISTGTPVRSSGVGRGCTVSVATRRRFPDEAQANRVRPARGARRGSRRALRRGRRASRRLRALLVVHGGNRYVPRRRRYVAHARRAGSRGACARAAARDGLSGGVARGGDRGAPARASLRRAGVRCLRALVKAKLSTDGGARGNPGPAAYGYVLETDDGTVLDKRGERIGVATNNVAEYRALVAGLEAARARGDRARGRLRFRAARQADARRVQGQERDPPPAIAEGDASRA